MFLLSFFTNIYTCPYASKKQFPVLFLETKKHEIPRVHKKNLKRVRQKERKLQL